MELLKKTIKKTNVIYIPIPTKKLNNIIKSIKKGMIIRSKQTQKQTQFKRFLRHKFKK